MVYRNHTMDEDEFEYFIFKKNLQGDIVAVCDEYGFAAVTYTYDAWGNVTETLYDTTSNGQYNSFRYRGYFYDEDTGLYYLNSRYYDPVIGRFLNADIYVSTGQGLGGYNMYAYCRNEPVFRKDSLGTESVSVDNKDNDDNPHNDLGKSPIGGRGSSSPRYTPNQGAVIDLAKEYRGGMTVSDAKIISGWADEYGIKNHGIMIHPARSGIWSYTPHIKIANVHIPIIKE